MNRGETLGQEWAAALQLGHLWLQQSHTQDSLFQVLKQTRNLVSGLFGIIPDTILAVNSIFNNTLCELNKLLLCAGFVVWTFM